MVIPELFDAVGWEVSIKCSVSNFELVDDIAVACNRLIKNSIICWSHLYLARQLASAPDAEAKG